MVRSLGHIEGRVWMCLWRALGRAARRTAAHKVMVLYSPGTIFFMARAARFIFRAQPRKTGIPHLIAICFFNGRSKYAWRS